MGRMSPAHLCSMPLPAGFDAIRNCSLCGRHTDDDCAAWRKVRRAVPFFGRIPYDLCRA